MVKKNDNAVVDKAMVNADHSCNNNHEGSSNEEEEEFMNSSKFVKSLFSTNDNDDDDKQEIISEHVWTCPASEDIISIIYHLAFLAPGHGDSIWNSSECIAKHLLLPSYRSKLFRRCYDGDEINTMTWPPNSCIEFGAGAALPSLALLRQGAKRVVLTDRYVNQQTFDALCLSVKKNASTWGLSNEVVKERVVITGHTWGEDLDKLVSQAQGYVCGDCGSGSGRVSGATNNVDLLIASDCIYNPQYHKALLESATYVMERSSNTLFIVGYSFHMNVPPDQVLNFFNLAREEFRLEVLCEMEEHYSGQKGIGDTDEKRGTVYVKVLTRRN